MHRYTLEFILCIQESSSLEAMKNSIIEFVENLEIIDVTQGTCANSRDFKVSLNTEDPTIIFDTLAQFGRLRSVKVDEERG